MEHKLYVTYRHTHVARFDICHAMTYSLAAIYFCARQHPVYI